jgi:hypothetical protein
MRPETPRMIFGRFKYGLSSPNSEDHDAEECAMKQISGGTIEPAIETCPLSTASGATNDENGK